MAGLLIAGAGGHGRVVADTAFESGLWEKIAFLDDQYPTIQFSGRWPVVGTIAQAFQFLPEYSHLVVALGNNILRVELTRRLSQMGFVLATVIHPTAFISQSAWIGAGSVVFAQAAVNAGTRIGMASIINTSASIDHDCELGYGVHISPGVRLAGTVRVGNYSWLGIGSSVIQQVSIGDNVILGAGTVITENIPNDVTVVGVPGRIVKKHVV